MTIKVSDTNQPAWRRAEEWTAELFRALGYSVTSEVVMAGFQIDLIVRKDDLSHPVEIKMRRSGAFGMNELVQQAARLRAVTVSNNLGSGLIKSTIQERRSDRQRPSSFGPVCHSVLRYGGSPLAC
jgi:hypothetical protein